MRKHCWGTLAHHGLELASDEEVEFLVGAAEFHVGLDGDGVVGLEEGVEEFGYGDGAIGLVAAGEVVSFEELGEGEAAGEGQNVGEGELAEPFALEDGFGAVLVDYAEELVEVGLGVFHDLLVGEHGAGGGFAAGVAYLGGPVADDEDDFVSEFLKLAEFAEADDVAEVDVGPAGVEAHFEAEGLAFLEEAGEFVFDDDFDYAAAGDLLDSGVVQLHGVFLRLGEGFSGLFHGLAQFDGRGRGRIRNTARSRRSFTNSTFMVSP